MSIKGTVKDNVIVLDSDVPWPDGMRVVVVAKSDKVEDGTPSPANEGGQAALLARMDSMIPSEMTEEEFAEWEAVRQKEREEQKEMVRKSWKLEDIASK